MAKSEHEIVCICVVKIIVYYLSAVKPVLWAVRIGALGASVLTPIRRSPRLCPFPAPTAPLFSPTSLWPDLDLDLDLDVDLPETLPGRATMNPCAKFGPIGPSCLADYKEPAGMRARRTKQRL